MNWSLYWSVAEFWNCIISMLLDSPEKQKTFWPIKHHTDQLICPALLIVMIFFFFPVCIYVSGSNCSSSSEGEVTTLQAGICVKQLFVSIKDTIIAREALSLLVTCLQLRSQQLCKKKKNMLICRAAQSISKRLWFKHPQDLINMLIKPLTITAVHLKKRDTFRGGTHRVSYIFLTTIIISVLQIFRLSVNWVINTDVYSICLIQITVWKWIDASNWG